MSVSVLTNVNQAGAAITLVKTIGERLKFARGSMSQKELAALAHVSPGTIGNIESDARKNPRELLAIAAAVNVNPQWLQTGKGPMRQPEHTKLDSSAVPAQEPLAQYLRLDADVVLDRLQDLLRQVDPAMRAAFADLLHGWALVGGQDHRQPALLALLAKMEKRRAANA